MTNDKDPILNSTRMQAAWDAWQTAFDMGVLKPDYDRFTAWWESVALHTVWQDLRSLLHASWEAGTNDRNIQCTAGFDAWFTSKEPTDGTWMAWQAAFDAGRLLPSSTSFESWWEEIGKLVQWENERDKLQAAWGSGVQDRCAQSAAGFDAWWQQILDSQPIISSVDPLKG